MATIKGTARLKKVQFSKGDFVIAYFEPISIEEGSVEVHEKYNTFTMKGDMPAIKEGNEVSFIAEEGKRHPDFGMSYNIIFIRQNIDLDENDQESVKRFLEIILTEKQLKALYEISDNPLQLIKNKEIDKLTQAKGIGVKTAEKIIDHYESQKDYSYAYMELGKFDISPKVIKTIVKKIGSPELAVKTVKENPYQIMDIVSGFGFKKCDEIYLKTGGEINSELRIKAFLKFTLEEHAKNGHTWCTPAHLINATVEYIPNVDKTLIGKILLNDKDFYVSDEKQISLRKYQKLEENIAKELHRLMSIENKFDYNGWEDEVAKVEEEQGWQFTAQQKDAMKMMLESNVSILQGYGGTGKTTTLKAVVDILEKKGYLYAQCALSGKAANNLSLVTGKEGSTIHRLLGYDPENNRFQYNSDSKLPYDIIIVDEISMVDARLFYHLLCAIRDGAKLIMVGDSQQLESIGIPVMIPMIESGVIPTTTLTQIHRQAEKSAIITDSIAIRQGNQVVTEPLGRIVHGELKDLEYEMLPNDDDIFLAVMKEFYKLIKDDEYDINDIQVFSQIKDKGRNSCLAINKACQRVYNPPSDNKKEVKIGSDEKGYILREGDKVINVRNNYNAIDYDNNTRLPVFNGNIGILEKFDSDEDGEEFMVVNFEGIGRVKIYREDYGTIELAYCITVHKAQGSSSKVSIISFPYHYMLNSRQLIYTAITRAKKHCVVVTTKKNLVRAIRKDATINKRTYLAKYLKRKLKMEVNI